MPRNNANPNPSAANNLTGIFHGGSGVRLSGLTGTPRSTGVRVTFSGGNFTEFVGAARSTAVAGQTWSGVMWVRASAARTVRVSLATWNNGSFVATVGGTTVALTANTWTQIRAVPTALSGTFTQVAMHVDGTSGWTAGDTLDVSSVRQEQVSDSSIVYADGDTSGWAWNGTAGNSSSMELEPTLVQTYTAEQSNSPTTLTTPSFAPRQNEVLVVKVTAGDEATVLGTPSGGGLTYQAIGSSSTTDYTPTRLFAVRITAANPATMAVTVTTTGTQNGGSPTLVVERWANASLASTPASVVARSTSGSNSAPSASLTPTNAASAISWVVGDWVPSTTTTVTYRGTATENYRRRVATSINVFSAWQRAGATSAQTLGLTSPSNMKWTLIGVEIIPGPAPIESTNTDSAAVNFGWGNALPASDEFGYTGAPDPTRWGVYDGPGHAGNGTRDAAACTVQSGYLRITGTAGGSTGGISHKFGQQYGRWEIRARTMPVTAGSAGFKYHPVLIIWPDSELWPQDGEYDFLEVNVGDTAAGAYLHYPHPVFQDGHVEQAYVQGPALDLTQWHNYAFEWTATGLKGWIDGVPFYPGGVLAGGAQDVENGQRRNIQDMKSGHLTIQMDNFDAQNTGLQPAYMDVEWARVYALDPGPGVWAGGDGTGTVGTAFTRTAQETGTGVTARTWTIFSGPAGAGTQIGTAAALSWTPTVPGNYYLRYQATNPSGTSTDYVKIVVADQAGTTTRVNESVNPALASADGDLWYGPTGSGRVTGLTGMPRTTGWDTGQAGQNVTARFRVSPNEWYSSSIFIRSQANDTVSYAIDWFSPTELVGTSYLPFDENRTENTTAGVVKRLICTGLAPGNAVEGLMTITTGQRATMTGHQVERRPGYNPQTMSPTASTYFDGDSGAPAAWTGTAQRSTSTTTVADAVTTNAPATIALGSGVAEAPTEQVRPTAGAGSGTGQGFGAVPTTEAFLYLVDAAQGSGTAHGATARQDIARTPGVAAGAGAAAQPSVATSLARTPATAGGAGAALQPSAAVRDEPTTASGTGAAFGATVRQDIARPVDVATGSGAALGASGSVADTPATAAGSGAALGASSRVRDTPGTGAGSGTANPPAGSSSIARTPAAAAGAGAAEGATAVKAVSAFPGTAAASGAALAGRSSVADTPPTAAGSGAAHELEVSTSLARTPATAAGTGAGHSTAGSTSLARTPAAAAATGAAAAAASSVQDVPQDSVGSGAALPAAAAVRAGAGTATGAGAAAQPTPSTSLARTPGQAAGTGAAAAPTPSTSLARTPGTGSGSGTAVAPSTAVRAPAGAAAATGAALPAAGSVAAQAAAAAAAGTAHQLGVSTSLARTPAAAAGTGSAHAATPSTSLARTPGTAEGTGSGSAAAPQLAARPTEATADGTAEDAATAVVTSAQPADATGTASTPAGSSSLARTPATAGGSGTALAPQVAVDTTSGAASSTGQAHTAGPAVAAPAGTASGSGAGIGAAGLAAAIGAATTSSSTGTANRPAGAVTANPAQAAGAGAAAAGSASVRATAGLAAGSGAASGLASKATAAAGTAAGSGTATAPTLDLDSYAPAGAAAGSGAASNATGQAPGEAVGREATATGAGYRPGWSVVVSSGTATAAGAAGTARPLVLGRAGVATGSGQASLPDTLKGSTPPTADGAGTAFAPERVTVVATAATAHGVGTVTPAVGGAKLQPPTAAGQGTATTAAPVVSGRPGTAAADGQAATAGTSVQVRAGSATAAGAALELDALSGSSGGHAAGSGQAGVATPVVTARPGTATAEGLASQLVPDTDREALGQTGHGAGAAFHPGPVVRVQAGTAHGTGLVPGDARAQLFAAVEAALAEGVAANPRGPSSWTEPWNVTARRVDDAHAELVTAG